MGVSLAGRQLMGRWVKQREKESEAAISGIERKE